MSWTKRQFVLSAFEEIGIGSYNFDLPPEMLEMGRKRLDAMMATWNAKGMRLAYPIPSNPNEGDLDEDSNVPDSVNEAVYLNLAIRLAPAFGKQIAPEMKQEAFRAFNVAMAKNMTIQERQGSQTIPAGQGNKWRKFYSPYLLRAEDLPSDNDGVVGQFN
ncbi:MAG: packaged DNA stabilization gp4 family protein [Bdellovibrionales bacterium]|jgi:hypothetical protein